MSMGSKVISILLLLTTSVSAAGGADKIDATMKSREDVVRAEYLPQAQEFFSRVPALNEPRRKQRYNIMIGTMLSCPNGSGNAWGNLDALVILDAPSATIAYVNVVQPAFSFIPHGGIFTPNHGWAGDGSTAYGDTQFVPATAGGRFTTTSASLGLYVLTARKNQGFRADIGTNFNSRNYSALLPLFNGPNTVGMLNLNNFNLNSAPASTQGMWAVTADSTAKFLYQNKGQVATYDMISTGMDDVSFILDASWNGIGGATFANSDDQIAAYFIGGFLTAPQYACVADAVNAFLAGDRLNVFPVSQSFASQESSSLATIFSGQPGSSLPTLGVSAHLGTPARTSLSDLTWSDGTATATSSNPIGMKTGTTVRMVIQGAVPNSWNGTYSATITSANTFTFRPHENPGIASTHGTYGQVISPMTNASLATRIGATLVRTDLSWVKSDPEGQGANSFAWLDPTVAALRSVGLKLELAFDYGNAGITGCFFCGPKGSAQLAASNKFMVDAVNHYGTTDVIYEIWNEANIGGCSGDNYAWSQAPSAKDYSSYVTSGAAAIADSRSDATLITGGLAPSAGACYITPNNFIASVVANADLTHLAGFGFHPYGGGIAFGDVPENAIANNASFADAALRAKPIYWDEIGYPITRTDNSEALKGIFVARLLASAVISQVKQVVIYDLIDDGPDAGQESNFGLFSFGLDILPAGTAFGSVAAFLKGCLTVDAGKIAKKTIWELGCHVADGARYMVWCEHGAYRWIQKEGSISAASATDVFGNAVPVTLTGTGASFDIVDTSGPVILTVTNFMLRRDLPGAPKNDNRPVGVDVAA